VDWKDIKSVEEILTERTGIDCRLQVAVRCDQHAHVDGKRLTAPDAFKLFAPAAREAARSAPRWKGRQSHPEKWFHRRLLQSVQCAFVRCPGEGAFLVAESSDVISEGENRCTVNANERPAPNDSIVCEPHEQSVLFLFRFHPQMSTVESVGATFANLRRT